MLLLVIIILFDNVALICIICTIFYYFIKLNPNDSRINYLDLPQTNSIILLILFTRSLINISNVLVNFACI